MLVARRKTGHTAKKRSRHRPIALFVYVAHTGEILVRGGLYQEPLSSKQYNFKVAYLEKGVNFANEIKDCGDGYID